MEPNTLQDAILHFASPYNYCEYLVAPTKRSSVANLATCTLANGRAASPETGGKDKTAVMGILESGQDGGKVRTAVIQNKTKTLQCEVRKHVEAASAPTQMRSSRTTGLRTSEATETWDFGHVCERGTTPLVPLSGRASVLVQPSEDNRRGALQCCLAAIVGKHVMFGELTGKGKAHER